MINNNLLLLTYDDVQTRETAFLIALGFNVHHTDVVISGGNFRLGPTNYPSTPGFRTKLSVGLKFHEVRPDNILTFFHRICIGD